MISAIICSGFGDTRFYKEGVWTTSKQEELKQLFQTPSIDAGGFIPSPYFPVRLSPFRGVAGHFYGKKQPSRLVAKVQLLAI